MGAHTSEKVEQAKNVLDYAAAFSTDHIAPIKGVWGPENQRRTAADMGTLRFVGCI